MKKLIANSMLRAMSLGLALVLGAIVGSEVAEHEWTVRQILEEREEQEDPTLRVGRQLAVCYLVVDGWPDDLIATTLEFTQEELDAASSACRQIK